MSSREDDRAPLAFRLYDLAIGEDDARLCRDVPEAQCDEQPRNYLYQTAAQALSKIGDTLADSKVVLPWLLGTVGAPLFLTGLLVPIRESLALLPQILVGGFIRRFARRKHFWSASSLVEGPRCGWFYRSSQVVVLSGAGIPVPGAAASGCG